MTQTLRRGHETKGRAGAVDRALARLSSARRALELRDGRFDALRLDVADRSAVAVAAADGRFALASPAARYRLFPLVSLLLRALARAARRLPDRRSSYFPLTVDIDVVARLRLPLDAWLERGLLVPSVMAADTYVLLPAGNPGGQPITVSTLRRAG